MEPTRMVAATLTGMVLSLTVCSAAPLGGQPPPKNTSTSDVSMAPGGNSLPGLPSFWRGRPWQPSRPARPVDAGWYLSLQGGFVHMHRGPAQGFPIGYDSNDSATLLDSSDLPQSGWGRTAQVIAGRHMAKSVDAELRFRVDNFHTSSGISSAGVSEDAFDPFTPNFYVPYLDAGMTTGGGARPLAAGIYGVRYKLDKTSVTGNVDYNASILDWGVDVVWRACRHDGCAASLVIGPAFAYVDQDLDFTVTGSSIGGWRNPTIVVTGEDIREFYGGAKLGVRGSKRLNNNLNLQGSLNGYLYAHNATLRGDQNIASGGTFVSVADSRNDLAPRLGLRTGCVWGTPEKCTVGLFYALDVWGNAATVENPSLTTVSSEGGTRWVGSHPARLARETVVTQGIVLEARIWF